jgi:hypothetical protein
VSPDIIIIAGIVSVNGMIVGLLLGGPILDNRLESIAQALTEHLQDQVQGLLDK